MAWGTHKSAKLLETLQHACDDQRSPVSSHANKLREVIVDTTELGLPSTLCSLWDVSVSGCFLLFYYLPLDSP